MNPPHCHAFLEVHHHQSHGCSRVQATSKWSLLFLGIVILQLVPHITAQTCAQMLQQYQSQVNDTDGTDWGCCYTPPLSCLVGPDQCVGEAAIGQCLSSSGVRACSFSMTSGAAPCGLYTGRVAPVGASVLTGNSGIDIGPLTSAVLENWTVLAFDWSSILCCSASTTTAASKCVTASIADTQTPCASGQHQVLCSGTAANGLCAVLNADDNAIQFLQITTQMPNTTPPAPVNSGASTSLTITGSSGNGSTATSDNSQATGTPTTPTLSKARAAVPAWAIALPVVLGVVLCTAIAAFLIRCRGHRAQAQDARRLTTGQTTVRAQSMVEPSPGMQSTRTASIRTQPTVDPLVLPINLPPAPARKGGGFASSHRSAQSPTTSSAVSDSSHSPSMQAGSLGYPSVRGELPAAPPSYVP